MGGVDRAGGGSGGRDSEEHRSGDSESRLLTLHHRAGGSRRRSRRAGFGDPHDREHHRPQSGHHTEQRQALATVTHQCPVCAGEAHGDEKYREDLHDIRQRRRIGERMRRVRRERATAVGAEDLDGLLRREWPHRGVRLPTVEGGDIESGVEGLHRALDHQHAGHDDADGQQDSHIATHQVHPEVANLAISAPADDAADEGHGHGHAHRRGHEVLDREAEHLTQIAHHHLGRIRLPIGVRDERHRGVECHRRRHPGLAVGPRQDTLQPLEQIDHDHRDERKGQHRKGVADPGL